MLIAFAAQGCLDIFSKIKWKTHTDQSMTDTDVNGKVQVTFSKSSKSNLLQIFNVMKTLPSYHQENISLNQSVCVLTALPNQSQVNCDFWLCVFLLIGGRFVWAACFRASKPVLANRPSFGEAGNKAVEVRGIDAGLELYARYEGFNFKS